LDFLSLSLVYLVRWPWRAQDWFDINDRRSVDGLDGTDSQTILDDLPHGDLMKPNGIGPVWGARCEHPGKSSFRIRPRVNLENITIRSVKPSQDDDLVTRRQTIQSLREARTNRNPDIGRTL